MDTRSGWGFPMNSKKAHWFADGTTSLCGRWFFLGEKTPDTGNETPGPDDCATCFRKLRKAAPASKVEPK